MSTSEYIFLKHIHDCYSVVLFTSSPNIAAIVIQSFSPNTFDQIDLKARCCRIEKDNSYFPKIKVNLPYKDTSVSHEKNKQFLTNILDNA